jgi:thiol-disulfide isomerase/thioredoxin
MMKITDILKSKYYLPNKRNVLIIALLIVFMGILVYFYSKFAKNRKEKMNVRNVANANTREKTADILFFHTDWCPHCIKALPTWKNFVDTYDKTVVNRYRCP